MTEQIAGVVRPDDALSDRVKFLEDCLGGVGQMSTERRRQEQPARDVGYDVTRAMHTWPETFEGHGGGSHVGGMIAAAGGRPVPHGNPFEQVVAGWMTIAEHIGDFSPEVGGVLGGCGQTVRAALEAQARHFIEQELPPILDEIGPPRSVRQDIAEYVLSGHLAVTPEEAAEATRDAVTALEKPVREELTNSSAPNVLAAITRRVIEAAPEAMGSQWTRSLAVKGDPNAWWVSASLDSPRLLGSKPVQCIRPCHRWGDRISADEFAYTADLQGVLTNSRVREGAVEEKYSRDLEKTLTPGYYKRVEVGVHAHVYVLRLAEEHGALRKWFSSRLKANRSKLREKAEEAGRAAGTLAAATLTADLGGLAGAAAGVTGATAGILTDWISDLLLNALAEPTFPSWGVHHTTLYAGAADPELPPLSVVLLFRPTNSRGWMLHRLVNEGGEPWDPLGIVGPLKVMERPRPSAEYDVREFPQYMQRGRMFPGPTVDVDPGRWQLVASCPEEAWKAVAEIDQPIIWFEGLHFPKFQVLLPQRAENGKGSYVSALRVDVGLEQPAIR